MLGHSLGRMGGQRRRTYTPTTGRCKAMLSLSCISTACSPLVRTTYFQQFYQNVQYFTRERENERAG